ncbi:MAG: hypothetical protein NT062_23805 [Proteobacteria bacterium]|nr:hypothetical protein [Pseudomonadota bacterium]
MRWLSLIAAATSLGSRDVRAEHVHADTSSGSQLSAAVALVVAQYETLVYGGVYEGAIPSLAWVRGRFAVMASAAVYRLEENGRTRTGLGDTMAGVSGVAATTLRGAIGGMVMAMAPTGEKFLGMGHPMVMPSVFARYHAHPMLLAGALGFARALGGEAEHHDHGAWPLVAPMNMSELTWSASGDLMVNPSIMVGGRASGGVPIGAAGATRVIGGLRIAWGQGRLSTAAEVQTGLVGDPFLVRGVLETSMTF